MNDTQRLNWLEDNNALVNEVSEPHTKGAPSPLHTAHVSIGPERHYWGTTYREAIDNAAKAIENVNVQTH